MITETHRGLVELMTICAIVGLLMAILIASLASGRKQAEATPSHPTGGEASSTQRVEPEPASRTSTTASDARQAPEVSEPKPWWDSAIILAIVASGLAAIGWLFKSIMAMLRLRVQLGIVETLSDGERRNRRKLCDDVSVAFPEARVLDVFRDALAELFKAGKIEVADREYFLPVGAGTDNPGGASKAAAGRR